MRKNVLIFAVFILLSIISYSAFAQSPQISNGLTWLNSSQTTTGNWPQVVTSEYHSTAAALDATYALEPTSSIYTTGLAWLGSQVVSPTDYLSRQIITLKRAGQDASNELATLLLYRNASGGWGGDAEYLNDIIDTALALQALKAANYSDANILYQAVNYLTINQNIDSGFGFTSGGASNAYVTAYVLRALSAYSSTFDVKASISKASAYLLTKQNADGGFGSSPSNAYETALSIISLTPLESSSLTGQAYTTALQNAINYLTTTQSANGSWNDDPYSTALALQALANVKPNLAVTTTDITFSKLMPQTGESITITAVIKNTGLEPASTIIVRFYQGDPLAGGVQIGSDKIIPSLTPNSSTPISVTTTFTGTGTRNIFVVADPDNLISEITKVDNKAAAQLWVATGADLAVFSSDLKPSTYTPASNTAFTLQYAVRNLGESATNGFDVAVYDGSPTGTPLQTGHISGIGGTETRTGTFGVTLTGDGPHTLYIVADPGNAITETTKANNIGTKRSLI